MWTEKPKDRLCLSSFFPLGFNDSLCLGHSLH